MGLKSDDQHHEGKGKEVRDTETWKGRPCEDRGKDQNDVPSSQGTSTADGSHKRLEESVEQILLQTIQRE